VPRYKLTIAYDGTDFCGWQKQMPYESENRKAKSEKQVGAEPADAGAGEPLPELARHEDAGRSGRRRVELRTVAGVLERAVREIVREPVEVKGSSRTDAGVHARGQVAAFTCSAGRDEETEKRGDGAKVPEREGGAQQHSSTAADDPQESRTETNADGGSRAQGGWPVARGVDRLVRAINGRLPDDALVLSAEVVPDGFDPIGHTIAKAYSYTLHVSRTRPLWDRHFVHHVWEDLDLSAMQAGAQHFVGEHDFSAFAAAGHGRKTTVRTVHECRVEELPCDFAGTPLAGPAHLPLLEGGGGGKGSLLLPAVPLEEDRGPSPTLIHAHAAPSWQVPPARRLRIHISGNGFLYNMVRIIAGTLAEVGRGHIEPDDIPRIIENKNRGRAGPTFPPEGLCLEWIRYGT